MALLKTINDLQLYVRVNVSVMEKSFLPYVSDATEKYLRQYLGDKLLSELEIHYNAQTEEYPLWADNVEKKAVFDRVLSLTQNALAKFTCFLAAPSFDLHLTEMGFVVQQNQTTTPASVERVRKMVESLESLGWDNLETLLRYLTKHHATILSYKDSDAFVFAHRNLINTADIFDKYVHIERSHLTFIKLRPLMDDVELMYIEPVIGRALSEQLKVQQRNMNLTDDNKALLILLQRATANYVIARHFEKPVHEHFAERYLNEAKKLLDKYPNKYTLYRDSEYYVPDKSGYGLHNNEDESKLFTFSG